MALGLISVACWMQLHLTLGQPWWLQPTGAKSMTSSLKHRNHNFFVVTRTEVKHAIQSRPQSFAAGQGIT